MRTIKFIRKGIQLFFLFPVIVFYNINIVNAQIGAYCGTCQPEKNALTSAKNELRDAIVDVKNAQDELEIAQNEKNSAASHLAFAETWVKTCEEYYDKALDAKGLQEDAVDYATVAKGAASDALALAMRTGVGIFAALRAYSAATYALAIAEAALPALVAAAAVALATYIAAKAVIPHLKDKYNKALAYYNLTFKEWQEALSRRFAAQNLVKQKEQELADCMAKIKIPEKCEKCESEKIVDKCYPLDCCDGVCQDSNDCCPICPSGQQCCNGTCEPILYEYIVTETITTCNGANTNSYRSNSCTGGTTGQLEYSFGVCIGGSQVSISCSGPIPIPCK